MTTIATIDRTGAVLPCAFLIADTVLRPWGEVYPGVGSAALSVITGPTFDDHKCTGASVPGRRGGT